MPTPQQIPLPDPLRILQTLLDNTYLVSTRAEHAFSHVLRLPLPELQGQTHSETLEERPGGVGVDGEGAGCELFVMRY